MHTTDWDDLRYFLEVVRAGSLTGAASRLGVNQTTASRRIGALERRLGTTLFDRSGNRWVITPVAEQLVASAEHMAEEANAIERQVMAQNQELSGRLRVTVADVCTQRLVMPAIEAFARQYPEVGIEIIATRAMLDLAAREADVALRSTDEPPPHLVGKRIGRIGYAVYATHELLEKIEADPDHDDVAGITWTGDGRSRPPWVEKSFPRIRRLHRTSELGLMLEMARRGMGLAQMPCALVEPDPLLHRVPARYVEPGWGLWVLSHIDLRTTARVRIFKEFLVAELEQRKAFIEGLPNQPA